MHVVCILKINRVGLLYDNKAEKYEGKGGDGNEGEGRDNDNDNNENDESLMF